MDTNTEKSNVNTVKICESVFEGGREVARLSIEGVSFEEKLEKINAFYREFYENIRKWFLESYSERARKDYLSSDEPKKEYTFRRYEYFLRSELKYCNGEYISVLLCFSVGRHGRGEAHDTWYSSQCWRAQDCTLLPIDAFLSSSRDRRRMKLKGKKPDGYYLSGEDLVCFCSERGSNEYIEKSCALNFEKMKKSLKKQSKNVL